MYAPYALMRAHNPHGLSWLAQRALWVPPGGLSLAGTQTPRVDAVPLLITYGVSHLAPRGRAPHRQLLAQVLVPYDPNELVQHKFILCWGIQLIICSVHGAPSIANSAIDSPGLHFLIAS